MAGQWMCGGGCGVGSRWERSRGRIRGPWGHVVGGHPGRPPRGRQCLSRGTDLRRDSAVRARGRSRRRTRRVGAEEGVARLEVAVDHAELVGLGEAAGGSKVPRTSPPAARALLPQAARVGPGDELHGEEDLVVDHADVVDGDDVGVGDGGQQAGLAGEALAQARLVAHAGGAHQLEGDLAVELGVEGAVDHAHAARADGVDDDVAAESGAAGPRGGDATGGLQAGEGCEGAATRGADVEVGPASPRASSQSSPAARAHRALSSGQGIPGWRAIYRSGRCPSRWSAAGSLLVGARVGSGRSAAGRQ